MLLVKPQRKKHSKVKLLGAVQINNTSYFVCKNNDGNVCLETGKEEKLQKAIGLDMRVFDDALTFKISLMVVEYLRYLEKTE